MSLSSFISVTDDRETLHIYTRVSTVAQAEHGTSLQSQQELGVRKAEHLGFNHKIWNEGGRSSHHEDIAQRPELNALYLAIKAGEVKHLWVYDQSRLSRNDQVASIFRYQCNKNSVTLYTKDGVFNLSSPTDKLFKQMLDGFAEFDNAMRAERSRLGKINRVRIGNWHGGPPPFGYKIEAKKLVLDEYEAEWVKKMFDEVANGKSCAQVKQMLDANAVSPRRKRGTWAIGSINKLLTNTHYGGYYKYKDKKSDETFQVQCPVIVDPTVWSYVQALRAPSVLRQPQKNATTKNFYLLRDLMYCAHCGRPLAGRVVRERYEETYYCPSRERAWKDAGGSKDKWKRGLGCGFARALNITLTDELVWNVVKDLHSKSSILKEEVRARVMRENGIYVRSEEELKELTKKMKLLQRKHTSLSESLGTLTANRILKDLNETSYSAMKTRLHHEIRLAEDQLQRVRAELSGASNGKKWVSWLNTFGLELDALDKKFPAERKEYIEGLIKRIDVRYRDDLHAHELTLTTHLPIVNDGITWRDKDDVRGQGRAAVRYDVYEGTQTTSLVVQKKGEPGFVLMKNITSSQVEKQSSTNQQSFN